MTPEIEFAGIANLCDGLGDERRKRKGGALDCCARDRSRLGAGEPPEGAAVQTKTKRPTSPAGSMGKGGWPRPAGRGETPNRADLAAKEQRCCAPPRAI